MALPHAEPGQVISLAADPSADGTRTLIKTSHFEVIRLVLPQGKSIPRHQAPGEIMVQCLEGRVSFVTMGQTIDLRREQMLYLAAGEPHALEASEDSSLLLTILLAEKKAS